MLPITHLVHCRLALRRHTSNAALLRDVARGQRINCPPISPIIKRFRMDFPGDPHGTQKPMDPEQVGGLGDVIINRNVVKKRPPKTVEDFRNPDLTQFWVSYGYDSFDKRADRLLAHLNCFLFGTVLLGGYIFSKWYKTDETLENWAVREAYIEMKRREDLGLPYVDRNYIPPEKVRLPTEEELEGRLVYY